MPHPKYEIDCVYKKLNVMQREEIVDFWLHNRAGLSPREASRRVDEVVCTARNYDNELVGLCTVFPKADLHSNVFLNYRMFIRPQDRVSGLMKHVLRQAFQYFQSDSEARCSALGMVIRTENRKLMRKGMRKLAEKEQWVFVRKDQAGCEIWKKEFSSS